MNGYQVQAESYRQVLDRDRNNMDPTDVTDMENKIRVFEQLAKAEPDDKYIMFDSSMFNDIYKGYVEKIIDELCEEEDTEEAAKQIRDRVTGKASAILDRMGAREAEEYYYNG